MIAVLLAWLVPAAALQAHGSPRELISLAAKEASHAIWTPWTELQKQTDIEVWSRDWWYYGGLSILSLSVFWLIAGVLYKRCCMKDPEPNEYSTPEDVTGEWAVGLCDCFKTPKKCLLGWCCLPVLWADTMRLAGFIGFWTALIVSLVVGPGLSLLGIGWLGMVVYFLYYRTELRKAFEMPTGALVMCKDCCTFAWCLCCAVIQEHSHLEKAHEVGHPMAKAFLLRN